jgi:hypothetical protein
VPIVDCDARRRSDVKAVLVCLIQEVISRRTNRALLGQPA